jgi:hypothetical protein
MSVSSLRDVAAPLWHDNNAYLKRGQILLLAFAYNPVSWPISPLAFNTADGKEKRLL